MNTTTTRTVIGHCDDCDGTITDPDGYAVVHGLRFHTGCQTPPRQVGGPNSFDIDNLWD
jgi:hypothetical protein